MTETQNLHLPQWEETDRIHHDDFNDAFDKIDTAVPRIVFGSYVGMGERGSSHPCTIDFGIVPKLVVIFSESMYRLLAVPEMTSVNTSSTNSYGINRLQWNGTSLTWYSTESNGSASHQMNSDGRTYYYVAIG